MSQGGFLIWTDFHPILVGAGCLALGYVYGRHCRSASEIPADAAPASDDACCAQSQSNNTYFEGPCKCCVSAPADLDAMAVGNSTKRASNKFTRSPYLVQDAAQGFEQAERSTMKRDLAHRMEKLEYTEGEAPGIHQHSSRPYFEKGYQMLEEERAFQAKSPYKKQKGSPVVKEVSSSVCSKGKAEMGFDPLGSDRVENGVGNEDDEAAPSVPWSREVLHRRIDYFNNVSETTAESGRSDESRKLRLIKKKFLKVSAGGTKGEAAYNSTSTTCNTGGVVVRSGSTSGLVQLATTLDPAAACYHEITNSPSSLYRISGGGCHVAETSVDPPPTAVQEMFAAPDAAFNFGNANLEVNPKETDWGADTSTACDPTEKQGSELESTTRGCVLERCRLSVAADSQHKPDSRTLWLDTHPDFARVTDRCSGRSELREVPGDEVLKVEIYELLNETHCAEVSFEEIVSLLETRLQTNLQRRKAHIPDLVREVISISKLLEKERAADQVESEQNDKATVVQNDLSSPRHLGKLPFSYDCVLEGRHSQRRRV